MRVRMRILRIWQDKGTEHHLDPGTEHELPTTVAEALIATGAAERLDKKRPAPVAAPSVADRGAA